MKTIPDITNLTANVAPNTKSEEIKNKIPDTRGFYTTLEFNRLTKIIVDARVTQEFNMIKGINETRILVKHISCKCRREFDARKCHSRQKWSNDKCQCECKKPI